MPPSLIFTTLVLLQHPRARFSAVQGSSGHQFKFAIKPSRSNCGASWVRGCCGRWTRWDERCASISSSMYVVFNLETRAAMVLNANTSLISSFVLRRPSANHVSSVTVMYHTTLCRKAMPLLSITRHSRISPLDNPLTCRTNSPIGLAQYERAIEYEAYIDIRGSILHIVAHETEKHIVSTRFRVYFCPNLTINCQIFPKAVTSLKTSLSRS
jgi:hypothetical protein